MKIVLIIFLLNIQSSYGNDAEMAATTDVFDTVQFVATEKGAWRIKTYATDEDVHVWSIDSTLDGITSLALTNTEKHYGDVLTEAYVLQSDAGIDGLRAKLKERGLSDHLEIAKSGAVFWTPAGTNYKTKSTPRT